MTNDDQDSARANGTDHGLAAMGCDELVALGEDLERRVRVGTATLEDFGALARAQRELARRAAARRSNPSRGAVEPV